MPGAMPGCTYCRRNERGFLCIIDYIFKDTESFHRLLRMSADSQLAAQCRLPIGTWSCIFKDADGVIYNANTNNTWSRIN